MTDAVPSIAVRCAAAQVIEQVVARGQSLATVLPLALARVHERDQSLLQELCYGTLRWYPQLQRLLERLLKNPLKPRQSQVHALLLLGLYQLLYLRIPAYAAVSEVVSAARLLRQTHATGLINGVLRNFERHRDRWLTQLAQDDIWRNAHPRWLLQQLQRDWPQHWQAIVEANNGRPTMSLRVNTTRVSRGDYLHHLAAAGIEAAAADVSATAIQLAKTLPVEQLPGFHQGWVSVQDPAAQLAAGLLDLQPGLRVLDACAAPGGKTCHILETEPRLAQVLALDNSAARLSKVKDNLARLQLLRAHTRVADALALQTWWDGHPYHRILVDAPCSGSGVIRRHPDIKVLRRENDIDNLAVQQLNLLLQLWSVLAPGGMLVYATCSVARQENEAVVARFLAAQAGARERSIVAGWGQPGRHGRQILPGESKMDGAYYACLIKNA